MKIFCFQCQEIAENKEFYEKLDYFIVNSLFITITNSNFDDEDIR